MGFLERLGLGSKGSGFEVQGSGGVGRLDVVSGHARCRLAVCFVIAGLTGLLGGCGGDAQLELAAADTLMAVSDQLEVMIDEYHEEVSRQDDLRESSVVSAFVVRVQADVNDQAALDSHAADFAEALGRIRADRRTEWARRSAAMDNVAVVREVARGLQRLAVESLTLKDEMRRYLSGWIEARRSAAAGEKSEAKCEKRLEVRSER